MKYPIRKQIIKELKVGWNIWEQNKQFLSPLKLSQTFHHQLFPLLQNFHSILPTLKFSTVFTSVSVTQEKRSSVSRVADTPGAVLHTFSARSHHISVLTLYLVLFFVIKNFIKYKMFIKKVMELNQHWWHITVVLKKYLFLLSITVVGKLTNWVSVLIVI